MTEEKTILFLYNTGLTKVFIKNLRASGYNIINFYENFSLPPKNIYDKWMNIVWRLFLRRTDYWEKRNKRLFVKTCLKQLEQFLSKKIDYAVFIRADMYSDNLFRKLINKQVYISSYQSDGIHEKTKNILNIAPYLNQVFCFDPADVAKYKNIGFKFLTNCYFPDEKYEFEKNLIRETKTVYYAGSGLPDRINVMEKLNHYFQETDFVLEATLVVPRNIIAKRENNIKFAHDYFDYGDYIKIISGSYALVDLVTDEHDGLSYRFFEALYYKKKLITNNCHVKKYDFYNPNNIFITDFSDLTNLQEWLQGSYEEIPEEISKKYSFDNWLSNMLNLPNKIQIPLP
ncbi:MAG TPA: hypothetical protein DCP54_01145 [Chryseobacterium sp.]|nr:hypothetical protein [Chryseobacterium sp.]